jgi:hypothetical protein
VQTISLGEYSRDSQAMDSNIYVIATNHKNACPTGGGNIIAVKESFSDFIDDESDDTDDSDEDMFSNDYLSGSCNNPGALSLLSDKSSFLTVKPCILAHSLQRLQIRQQI